jgi:biotin carboxyl carrier protein
MDDAQLDAIRRLLVIADTYHLRELFVEENGLRVTIRSAPPPPPAEAIAGPPGPAEPAYAPGVHDAIPDEEEPAPGHHQLRSPMTGIFYRSPSPDSPPFVEEGQIVEEGQTVGLLEAMKVFSEIPTDASGRILRILAEHGRLLHEGDILMILDVGEE